MPKSVVFHDGEIHKNESPLVAVSDQALVMGAGVFETLIAHHGKLFAFDRHMARLKNSADLMGIATPDRKQIAADISRALKECDFDHLEKTRIRLTLTGGIGDRRFSDEDAHPQLFIQVSPAPSFNEFASLVTVPFVRNDRGALAGTKTINYGENVVALGLARKAGADEAVFGNTRDQLCEGTWSNIFVFTEGKWLTPPLSSGCLPGVTRALVLELAEQLPVAIEEKDVNYAQLTAVDGAFLTSTLRGLQSVGEIDGRRLPSPKPPGFSELEAAFQRCADPKD